MSTLEHVLYCELHNSRTDVGSDSPEGIVRQRRRGPIRISDGRRIAEVHSILDIKCFRSDLNPLSFRHRKHAGEREVDVEIRRPQKIGIP